MSDQVNNLLSALASDTIDPDVIMSARQCIAQMQESGNNLQSEVAGLNTRLNEISLSERKYREQVETIRDETIRSMQTHNPLLRSRSNSPTPDIMLEDPQSVATSSKTNNMRRLNNQLTLYKN